MTNCSCTNKLINGSRCIKEASIVMITIQRTKENRTPPLWP